MSSPNTLADRTAAAGVTLLLVHTPAPALGFLSRDADARCRVQTHPDFPAFVRSVEAGDAVELPPPCKHTENVLTVRVDSLLLPYYWFELTFRHDKGEIVCSRVRGRLSAEGCEEKLYAKFDREGDHWAVTVCEGGNSATFTFPAL